MQDDIVYLKGKLFSDGRLYDGRETVTVPNLGEMWLRVGESLRERERLYAMTEELEEIGFVSMVLVGKTDDVLIVATMKNVILQQFADPAFDLMGIEPHLAFNVASNGEILLDLLTDNPGKEYEVRVRMKGSGFVRFSELFF